MIMAETSTQDREPYSNRTSGESSREQTNDSASATQEIGRRMKQVLRAHPVIVFFAVAFAYSWSVFGVLYGIVGEEYPGGSRFWHVPFAWGPLFAAILGIWLGQGSVRMWLRTVGDPRTPLKWYGLAVVVAVLLTDGANVLAGLAGVHLAVAQPRPR